MPMNAQKSFVLERVRFSVGVAAMRHHAARRARALAGSVLRARGVAAGLLGSPEAEKPEGKARARRGVSSARGEGDEEDARMGDDAR